MEKFNPTAYLLKIQKIKYTEAIIPILIIFSGFAINFIKPYSFVKYLSLLGLLGFLFISLKYRIRKNIPPEENGVILSPVYGVICNLNNAAGTFIIKKDFSLLLITDVQLLIRKWCSRLRKENASCSNLIVNYPVS